MQAFAHLSRLQMIVTCFICLTSHLLVTFPEHSKTVKASQNMKISSRKLCHCHLRNKGSE